MSAASTGNPILSSVCRRRRNAGKVVGAAVSSGAAAVSQLAAEGMGANSVAGLPTFSVRGLGMLARPGLDP
jgi:hypothetical protein